jgi:hypothetical protein
MKCNFSNALLRNINDGRLSSFAIKIPEIEKTPTSEREIFEVSILLPCATLVVSYFKL